MYKILAVDDQETNLDILVESLGEMYELRVALNGLTALDAIEEEKPDLILLDIMMPQLSGMELLQILKEAQATKDIPVIFLSAMGEVKSKTQGFEMGAVDYLTKPFEIAELKARVATHLELMSARKALKEQNEILEQKVADRTRQLSLLQKASISCLAALAETKDPETGGHILRTQAYVNRIAMELKRRKPWQDLMTEDWIRHLTDVAPLHDIGKVGIPEAILLKPGKLEPEEFTKMKEHCRLGQKALAAATQLVEESPFLLIAQEVALTHHEKWDGTGYPQGLKGEEIPLSGRIMALADVYDALICKRVYKNPMPHAKALQIIQEGAGSHFDPEITKVFLEIQEDIRQIALNHTDYEEERKALQP